MRDSPFFQRFENEARRMDIIDVLTVRFGSESAATFSEALNEIADPDRLRQLLRTAIKCRDITGFRRAVRRQRQG
jgi:hypothetical protein